MRLGLDGVQLEGFAVQWPQAVVAVGARVEDHKEPPGWERDEHKGEAREAVVGHQSRPLLQFQKWSIRCLIAVEEEEEGKEEEEEEEGEEEEDGRGGEG